MSETINRDRVHNYLQALQAFNEADAALNRTLKQAINTLEDISKNKEYHCFALQNDTLPPEAKELNLSAKFKLDDLPTSADLNKALFARNWLKGGLEKAEKALSRTEKSLLKL
jgi:hypothetical protein